jgi:protein-disulfide isomerase
MNDTISPSRRWAMPLACLAAAFAGAFASYEINAWRGRPAVEQVVHDYVLNHPEILPEAMERLQQRENAKQLAGVQDEVEKPFPGAIMGNPTGKVVMVEFMDFACGYCRQSVGEVDALIAANPDLKVVLRQMPILSPASEDAARMGLAAAQQGKYAAFHHAMYAAGRPDAQTIEAAARVAGVDLALAQKAVNDPAVKDEIERNMGFARQLGFQGTPSWIIGNEIHSGAVGQQTLAGSIAKARG